MSLSSNIIYCRQDQTAVAGRNAICQPPSQYTSFYHTWEVHILSYQSTNVHHMIRFWSLLDKNFKPRSEMLLPLTLRMLRERQVDPMLLKALSSIRFSLRSILTSLGKCLKTGMKCSGFILWDPVSLKDCSAWHLSCSKGLKILWRSSHSYQHG